MEKRYDVFVSCKSDDYVKAEPVYHWLVEKGHHPFFAPISLHISTIQGEPVVFGDEIDDALEQADNMILFATKAEYVCKGYVKDEWRTFVEEQRAGRKSGSLVTILDGVNVADLPIRLRSVQSFTLTNYKSGILRFLGNHYESKGGIEKVIEEAVKERKVKETVESGVEHEQNTKQTNQANFINGHEYVDLGLPSGTLWAICNVGANKPEDYGDYLSWGEGKTIAAKWGYGWYMPTKEQWKELMQNTNHIWTTRNGVYGRLFKASNGNSLFLPAAGFRGEYGLDNAGSNGYYWSSSLRMGYPNSAWYFNFYSGSYLVCYFSNRSDCRSVRAVRSMYQN